MARMMALGLALVAVGLSWGGTQEVREIPRLDRGMRITADARVAQGEYTLYPTRPRGEAGEKAAGAGEKAAGAADGREEGDAAVVIEGVGITVDFQGAVLRGAPADADPDTYTGQGIVIRGRDVTLLNAVVHGYKVGIHAEDVPGLKLISCDVSRNYRQRLKSTPQREDLSDWLFGHDNDDDQWLRYGAGIYLLRCPDGEVRHCRARNGQNGLCLVRSDRARVVDNDFSFLSGWGLAMWRSSGCGVFNNKFDFCMRGYSHGVYSRGQDSTGILVYEQCSHNVFAYNSATHGGDGLFLYAGNETVQRTGAGGCNDNIVYKNDFSHAAANGIEATFSRGNLFIDNVLDECDHGVWAGYSLDSVIQGNTIRNCRNGVSIEHGQGNVIVGNEFVDCPTAVHLWWDEDRDLLDSAFGRAHLHCPSGENRIVGNRFERCATAARIDSDSGSVIAGNHYKDVTTTLDARGETRALRVGPTDIAHEQMRIAASAEVRFDLDPDDPVGKPERIDLLAREPKLRTDAGRQDAFLSPDARRGRRWIFIDEWGPYDFSEVRVFPSRVVGRPEARFQVLGSGESFEVVTVAGDVSVTPTAGQTPGAFTVSPRTDGLTTFGLDVRTDGRRLPVVGILARADWRVRFYSWSAEQDPRASPENWSAITASAPLAEVRVPWLGFAWGHRPPAEGVPADHYATVAEATVELTPGRYTLRTVSDDGVRVLVDGAEVLSNWTWHGPTPDETTVTVAPPSVDTPASAGSPPSAGDGGGSLRPVHLRVEHFEIDGYAQLELELVPLPK